jgi:hypothetical protein
MTRAVVYLPDGRPGPGRLGEADLDVWRRGPAELVLPEATVADERGGQLFADTSGGALVFDPAAGGGPLAESGKDLQARAFGVTNTAFHVQRALRLVATLLGRPLPHLRVRVGMHGQPRRWGGGHYRLPARSLPEESDQPDADGEVHLGGGAVYLHMPDGPRYFHAPAHNAALIYHEIGHHLCRHTADFRLNRMRPRDRQTNKKVPVDEGTADFFAAALLGTPDIYGWHRHRIPEWERRRRKLDPRWTMAQFVGGTQKDPHADGTVWASACWSARQRVAASGVDPARFDAMLLRGLDLRGSAAIAVRDLEALRDRRNFSGLLASMAQADPQLAPMILAAMEGHGIRLGANNAELSEAVRADQARRAGA